MNYNYIYHKFRLIYNFILSKNHKLDCFYAVDICRIITGYDKYNYINQDGVSELSDMCSSRSCFGCKFSGSSNTVRCELTRRIENFVDKII